MSIPVPELCLPNFIDQNNNLQVVITGDTVAISPVGVPANSKSSIAGWTLVGPVEQYSTGILLKEPTSSISISVGTLVSGVTYAVSFNCTLGTGVSYDGPLLTVMLGDATTTFSSSKGLLTMMLTPTTNGLFSITATSDYEWLLISDINVTITGEVVVGTDPWVSNEATMLYDNSTLNKLVASNNIDAMHNRILVDFADVEWLTTIKCLETNALGISYEYSVDGVTYNILSVDSSSGYSTLQIDSTNGEAVTFINDQTLGQLVFAGGLDYAIQCRYLRITFNTTDNSELYIGELYVGRRLVQLENTRRYKQITNDKNESSLSGYKGINSTVSCYNVFNAEFSIYRPSYEVWQILKLIIQSRTILCFFPNGTTDSLGISHELSGNDIKLVQATGTWFPTVWGSDVSGNIDLNLQETEFVY